VLQVIRTPKGKKDSGFQKYCIAYYPKAIVCA